MPDQTERLPEMTHHELILETQGALQEPINLLRLADLHAALLNKHIALGVELSRRNFMYRSERKLSQDGLDTLLAAEVTLAA